MNPRRHRRPRRLVLLNMPNQTSNLLIDWINRHVMFMALAAIGVGATIAAIAANVILDRWGWVAIVVLAGYLAYLPHTLSEFRVSSRNPNLPVPRRRKRQRQRRVRLRRTA